MIVQHLFEEYRARPTAENLLALLRASADPAYNICFQVLRHRQDAEDAAQLVLLKIVSQAEAPSDLERFDRWLYRVALNTALHGRTQRARRIARENRRAFMNDSELVPDEVRDAVVEAIGDLDDEARCLVVQHFFEGRSLEEIARERGLSAVAIWKRIDRAKAMIRQCLAGAGALAALAGMDEVFAACRPVRAPLGLVSDAIVERAAAAAAATNAALVGGLIMAGKGISVAVAAAVSIALFVVGAGGTLLFGPSAAPPEPVAARKATPARGATAAVAVTPVDRDDPLTHSAAPAGLKAEAVPAELRTVGALLRDARNEKDPARARELYRLLNERWQSLRPAALSDPASLFAFLRSVENGEILSDLVALLANVELGPSSYISHKSVELPREVVSGLADLLSTGRKSEKLAVLQWLSPMAQEAKDLLGDRSVNLLSAEQDPELLSTILNTLHVRVPELNPKLEQSPDLLQNVWQRTTNWQVREQCLEALSGMKGAAGESLFIEKVQETLRSNDSMLAQYVPQILAPRLQSIALGEEDRYLPVFNTALTEGTSDRLYQSFLGLALNLPPAKAASVLEGARSHCPTATIQAGVDRALGLLRGGETRQAVIRRALEPNP